MVYAHGGGAIMCSAGGFVPLVNRYAVETLCTIISVEYRLAPEHKAPAGLYDMYAAFKYTLQNAEALGVDKSRIGLFGESGGGYITAGAGMILAEKDEGHLCKF
jgi:acetyl esterase